MTTPAGVPNLPVEALTVGTLADQLQNQTSAAARSRASQRIPSIFNSSTGGSIASDLTPFGIIGKIWAEVNSLIANANPDDITGPEDIPALLIHFIEDLPVVGQFVKLLEAFTGQYDGTDQILLTIQDLFGPLVKLAEKLVELLTGAPGSFDDLKTWSESLPLIGPLIAVLTGDAAGPRDIGALGTWAQSLLRRTSDIPAERLVGQISHSAFAQIPVANISVASPNLLSQGEFESLATIAPGNGWTYDEDENHSGKGGSAKVTANGTLLQLFSNQEIKVGEGDKLTVSTWIKTSGYTGSGTPIELSLVPFVGTTQQSTVSIAVRTSSTSWVQMSNASPYVIPAGVTSVRVRLAVTASATAGTIWFDDIALTKTGLLGQNLVDYLLDAWNKIWDGAFNINPLTPTTGKIWSDMRAAIANPLSRAEVGVSAAGTADGKVITVADGAYNAWYGGTGGTGAAAQVASTIASIKTVIGGGYTVETLTTSGTWYRTSTGLSGGTAYGTDKYLEFWAICIGGGGGGGKGGTGLGSGSTSGGYGGVGGGYVATQINPSDLPTSVSYTIASGQTSSGTGTTTTTFGSLATSASATPSISSLFGFYDASSSQPGSGGNGGGGGSGVSAGYVGGSTPLASGGTGAALYGQVGGTGGTASLTGQSRCGGGGGGGGSGQTGSGKGGTGGNGGFPGGGAGGGGGGGATYGTGGTGGNGAAGVIVLVYKVAA